MDTRTLYDVGMLICLIGAGIILFWPTLLTKQIYNTPITVGHVLAGLLLLVAGFCWKRFRVGKMGHYR